MVRCQATAMGKAMGDDGRRCGDDRMGDDDDDDDEAGDAMGDDDDDDGATIAPPCLVSALAGLKAGGCRWAATGGR